jgi:hypothetical protein
MTYGSAQQSGAGRRRGRAPPTPYPPAGTGPSAAPAPAAPRAGGAGDAAYCGQLSALYRKYLKNAPGHTSDFRAAMALEDCAKGNTVAGIPVLENILRREHFTLPAR